MKIEDVYSVEDLNIWSLTSGKSTAIVHMQLIPGSSSKWEEVQSKAKHLLLNTFGMYKCTIQLQSYRQEVIRTCANCHSSSTWVPGVCPRGLRPCLSWSTDLRAINVNLMESLTAVSMSSTSLPKTDSALTNICMISDKELPECCLQNELSPCRYLIRRQSKTMLH